MAEPQLSTLAGTDLLYTRSNHGDYLAAAQLLVNLTTSQLALATTPTAVAGKPVNAQTGAAYTLALTDAGKLVTCSHATAFTLTVPAFATIAFPVGTVIEVAQIGAGLVTVAAADGVTLGEVAATLNALGQYAVITLRKIAADTWLVNGDLAAS